MQHLKSCIKELIMPSELELGMEVQTSICIVINLRNNITFLGELLGDSVCLWKLPTPLNYGTHCITITSYRFVALRFVIMAVMNLITLLHQSYPNHYSPNHMEQACKLDPLQITYIRWVATTNLFHVIVKD